MRWRESAAPLPPLGGSAPEERIGLVA